MQGDSRFQIGLFAPHIRHEFMTGQQRLGFIRIGDFRERFIVPIDVWDEARYVAHWHDSLSRLGDGSIDAACLIVSFEPEARSEQLMWWVLYRIGNVVHVQNQMMFYAQRSERFDPLRPEKSILPREVLCEDGEPVSEWSLQFAEVQKYEIVEGLEKWP